MDYVTKTISQELEYLRLSTTGNKSLVYEHFNEKIRKISYSLNYHMASLMCVSKMSGFEQMHLTRVQKKYLNIQGIKTTLVDFILAHINAISILYYEHQHDLFRDFKIYKDKCDNIFKDEIDIDLSKEKLEEFISTEYAYIKQLGQDKIDFHTRKTILINSFNASLKFASQIFIRDNLFNAINMIQTCSIQDLEQVKKHSND